MSQAGPTRVLVIRFSSMGDVILTSPVVRALHAMLEGEVEVHFLTKSVFAAALTGLPGVHKVWTIEKSTAEVEQALLEVGFHYVIDLHSNARSGFIKRALRKEGAMDLTVDKKSLEKILLVRLGMDRLQGEHVVERYLDTLSPFGAALSALGGRGDGGKLALPEPAPIKKPAGAELDSGRVVLALGAAHVGKAIPIQHWLKIVAHLEGQGRPVDLIGGPDEAALAAELAASFEGADVLNHCGAATWSETFYIIGRGALLVAGDTGAMHAGAALHVPMVVVWGCTSPALGMGPWMPHPSTVQLEPEGPTRSRPCSRLGDRCRHKVRCPERVSPQRVIDAIEAVLTQTMP